MITLSPGLFVAIAVGGASGAVLRFLIQHYSVSYFGLSFPWGTLFVNVTGCCIIGLVSGYWSQSGYEMPLEIRGALVIGCLGAFTTFSAFSMDTLLLYQTGEIVKASLNVIGTVILCLIAVIIGSVVGSKMAA